MLQRSWSPRFFSDFRSSLLLALACAQPFVAAPLLADHQTSSKPQCQLLSASGNAEYPPYLWRLDSSRGDNARLTGANALLMDWLAKETNIEIQVRFVGPWGRTQREMSKGAIDLMAGAFYTQPRADVMDYLHPAFQQTRTSVWVRKDKEFEFTGMEDLKGKTGVTVINNSFGQQFDQYAADNLHIIEAVQLSQGLRMLHRGRVDYLLYEDYPARAYASQMGLLQDIKPLEQPLSQEPLYLTISKRSACNTPQLRHQLSDALIKAERQGIMKQYLQQSLEYWSLTPH